MPEYRTQFKSHYENVGEARRQVVDFAAQWFSGADLADIECAIGEALANSAEHGAKGGGWVDVHCWITRGKFVMDVCDTGAGFDRWDAVDYMRPMENAARGYGMFIMRELMDEMEYSDHGKQLRLVKRLPARSTANLRAITA